ncbi:nitroreductase family protein, partial [Thiolapillus sp.]
YFFARYYPVTHRNVINTSGEESMSHPIVEDLRWRHTAKKYDPARRVSETDMEVLFETLRLSASSINSQPWRFVVIESDEARQRIHDTFVHKFQFNQPHVMAASQIILLAHNPRYTREDYAEVVDNGIEDGRTKPEAREDAFGAFAFAEMNMDENGDTHCWTKAQLYIALGNILHTLARLRIDATPMEGIDTELVNQAFEKELDGYQCDVALAMGYSHKDDYNAKLPKSRRRLNSILIRI